MPRFLTLLREPGILPPLGAVWGLADTTCMGTAVVPRPQGAQGEFCNSLAANQTPTGGLPSLPRGGALACKAALEGCCLHGKGLSPRQPRVPTTHQEGSPPQRKLKRKLHYTETCVTNANPSHLDDKSSLIVFPNQAHTHTHTHTHTHLWETFSHWAPIFFWHYLELKSQS